MSSAVTVVVIACGRGELAGRYIYSNNSDIELKADGTIIMSYGATEYDYVFGTDNGFNVRGTWRMLEASPISIMVEICNYVLTGRITKTSEGMILALDDPSNPRIKTLYCKGEDRQPFIVGRWVKSNE